MIDRANRILLATLLWCVLVVGLLAVSQRPTAPVDVQLPVLPGRQLALRLQAGGIGAAWRRPNGGYRPLLALRLPLWVFITYALAVAAVGIVAGHWTRRRSR